MLLLFLFLVCVFFVLLLLLCVCVCVLFFVCEKKRCADYIRWGKNVKWWKIRYITCSKIKNKKEFLAEGPNCAQKSKAFKSLAILLGLCRSALWNNFAVYDEVLTVKRFSIRISYRLLLYEWRTFSCDDFRWNYVTLSKPDVCEKLQVVEQARQGNYPRFCSSCSRHQWHSGSYLNILYSIL